MEFDDKTYDNIEKYLNNELKGEELLAFENEKKSNQALAEEIEVNAQMKAFLADTPENSLRQNLQDLGNQFEEEKAPVPISKGNSFRYLFQAAALIFLAAMAWWIYNQSTSKSINEKPNIVNTPPKNDTPDPKEDLIDPTKDNNDNTNIVEDNPKQNEKPDIEPPKKDPIKITPPKNQSTDIYAANFTPNPSIEVLLDNVRSNEFELKIEKQIRNVSISSLEDVVNFIFSGVITSDENLIEKEFKLHIFSNDKTAYQDFTPLLSNDITFKKAGDEDYNFDFNKYIVLKPGLYYYFLEDTAIEKIYHTDKFEVRLQ